MLWVILFFSVLLIKECTSRKLSDFRLVLVCGNVKEITEITMFTYHKLAQISIFLNMQTLIIVFVTPYLFVPVFLSKLSIPVIVVMCLFDCL